MKPIVRHLLAAAAVVACLFLWLVGDRMADKNRREVTLNRVEAIVADSLQRKFISEQDIQDWMADYGTYMGLRLDSLDLGRVEALIDSKGAVRKSQAWLTDDGTLHISITQRAPIVRFQGASGGLYADAEGFLFPLQSRHTVRVPVVDGALPFQWEKGFKGEAPSEESRQWIGSMLDLVRYLDTRQQWNGLVGQITVRKDGNLVLIPREGPERFLFGNPTGIEGKFSRIKTYYERIAPAQESPYRSVDVRYDRQIVCKK